MFGNLKFNVRQIEYQKGFKNEQTLHENKHMSRIHWSLE